jgi:GxxExxY protein
MTENEIAKVVVDAAYKVHTRLGPGLLESVYQVVLAYEIRKRGLLVAEEVVIPIQYEELAIQTAFRSDMIVENKVILELKSVETELPVHKKQLMTYLKLTDLHLGSLINFGQSLLKMVSVAWLTNCQNKKIFLAPWRLCVRL